MRRPSPAFSVALCAVALVAGSAGAATYTTFAVPNFKSTQALSVNDDGTVTGVATDSGNEEHGFFRTADGTITVFDPPGSVSTQPTAIDADGTIVGTYGDGSLSHGFSRAPDGTFTTFDAPNAIVTYVEGIDGAIVGNGTRTKKSFGYLRSKRGKFDLFKFPGALDTEPRAANRDGTVVGVYHKNQEGNARGFVRYPDGTFEDLDVGRRRVFPEAINEDGAITGAAQPNRGFVRTADGVTRFIKIKGMLDILPYGITASGDVAGVCYDGNFTEHGFVWIAAKDATVFDVPGATRTWVNGVSPNGQITGTYSSPDGTNGSFLRAP